VAQGRDEQPDVLRELVTQTRIGGVNALSDRVD
jgi:hypothetical protein